MAVSRPKEKRPPARTATAPTPAVVPAIYLRVSTDDQAKEGYGLDAQLRRCLAQVIVKDWPEVAAEHIYRDEGLSGTLPASERPALAQLLADVQAKQISAVIILALDRLGRKTRIVLDVVDMITEAGAELVSCKESLDTTTPAGRFVLTIFAALAQLERDNIIERTTSGRDERGLQDGEKGGRVPYGYLRIRTANGQTTGIEVEKAQAVVVRLIFKHKKAGKSLRFIASLLNTSATPSPQGSRWHASSVAEVLKNHDAYAGGRRGESTARWPRILTSHA